MLYLLYRLTHLVTELRPSSPGRHQARLGERTALSHGISDEMLSIKRNRFGGLRAKSSQGSIDEDNYSEIPNSLTDLTAITRSDSGHIPHSGGQEVIGGIARGRNLGKFSSRYQIIIRKLIVLCYFYSTSNLVADGISDKQSSSSRLGDQNSRLRLKVTRIERSMEDLRKEKLLFAEKVSILCEIIF